ncbi:MAG: S49 family peptidase [Gammaproteobacteria bacterium]|nr:S49 family peptidase [Gammaproteobacteria bacterium]MBU1653997.1 S49 family peptidase [Gammaproteobacteria bacterium]MBU1960451.1 S49 family peptidase [Gammaproteobacteria bacterium]
MDESTQKETQSEKGPGWEQGILRDLAMATLKEQRAARRWGIFFKLLFFAYFLFGLMIWAALSQGDLKLGGKNFTALVDLNGVIKADSPASADKVVRGLRDAFKHKGTKGVVLRINSPGGSPVQARYIYDEIIRLRKKYPQIPLYAVIADLGASGGYYVAAAADRIYADKGSLVGSIGVLMNGFGFVEALQKLGVERRLLTAGENKGMLDPFSPLKEEEKTHAQGVLGKLHGQFIEAVKQGRGGRLKQDGKIFSGMFWSGEEARALGLIDGFGSAGFVAREVVGAEEMVNFSRKDDLFERLAERVGAGSARILMNTLSNLGGIGGM